MMSAENIAIKQELDDEETTGNNGTQTRLDMPTKPKEADDNITTAKTVFKLKTESSEDQNYDLDDEIPLAQLVGEQFLIYELEDVGKSSATATNVPVSTKPTIINTKLRQKRFLLTSSPTKPQSAVKKCALETLPATNTTQLIVAESLKKPTAPTSAATLQATPPTIELKVKCLCRLGNPVPSTSTEALELQTFFNEMFNETRQLSHGEQRQVKMSLLQAISESEEQLDAGRWCEKCCN